MNIGQVLRSLIQSTPSDDTKTLELKVGQVVKGMVLQLLGEQDALININGVQLKAKLETPLKQGEVTMLQVQPESVKGQIILKPLGSSGVQITENSLADLLEDFGVQDQPSNRQLVQLLHQEKVPLSKDNVKAFIEIVSQPPQNVDEEEWKQTAFITIKRGLPLTTESVKSLHQALFGKPMAQTLTQLSQQISDSLSANKFISPEVKETMQQVKQLVDHLIETSNETNYTKTISPKENVKSTVETTAAGNIQPKPAIPFAARQSQGNSNTVTSGNQALSSPQEEITHSDLTAGSAGLNAKLQMDQGTTQDSPIRIQPAPTVPVQINQGSTQDPALSFEQQDTSIPEQKSSIQSTAKQSLNTLQQISLTQPQSTSNPVLKTNLDPLNVEVSEVNQQQKQDVVTSKEVKVEQLTETSRKEGAPAAASPQKQELQWIPKLLKTMGMEHEQQLFKLLDKPDHEQGFHKIIMNTELQNIQNQMAGDSQQTDPEHPSETLKGALLSLFSTEGLPPAIKESAQQLVQQITGQQLLLSPDRTSMFSHITLMLPLPNQTGQQSSAVHIQSRKGKRGELDANNCRLLFDLRMKSIGNTLVDVHVVDRIVSLHVHNEHPIVAQLLESQRSEIESSLNGIGYQFLSLKCSPFPDQTVENGANSEASKQDGGNLSLTSLYSSKPYKGVDIRV